MLWRYIHFSDLIRRRSQQKSDRLSQTAEAITCILPQDNRCRTLWNPLELAQPHQVGFESNYQDQSLVLNLSYKT
ncbi:hypothetical protein BJP34_25345 [Moorena producens PAL-8-15-08-1]|uniref:Uncharacterized protein n=1 Tax=Moorena producens PAL-8-15-08-1 TaxID=1458985 RepID=A0A1D8TY00_9CYAN|nr:hypothetical protein BJP34_25345 [Moorena producens PAL-8-15-08-1]